MAKLSKSRLRAAFKAAARAFIRAWSTWGDAADVRAEVNAVVEEALDTEII